MLRIFPELFGHNKLFSVLEAPYLTEVPINTH